MCVCQLHQTNRQANIILQSDQRPRPRTLFPRISCPSLVDRLFACACVHACVYLSFINVSNLKNGSIIIIILDNNNINSNSIHSKFPLFDHSRTSRKFLFSSMYVNIHTLSLLSFINMIIIIINIVIYMYRCYIQLYKFKAIHVISQ